MKIKNSTGIPIGEKPDLIRALVLGFRTRTLTLADHRKISSWLDESEQNQQLFEKWITDPAYRITREDRENPANYSTHPPVRAIRWILLLLVISVLLACLIYVINR